MNLTTRLSWAGALRVSIGAGVSSLVILKYEYITEFGVSGQEVFVYSETCIIDL